MTKKSHQSRSNAFKVRVGIVKAVPSTFCGTLTTEERVLLTDDEISPPPPPLRPGPATAAAAAAAAAAISLSELPVMTHTI